MKGFKALISQALFTLKENIERTGDPLGFKHSYWIQWTEGVNLLREGKTILLSARMYQMLPYIIQTTNMVMSVKPLLSIKGFGKIINVGNRLAGEQVLRLKARRAKEIKERGDKVLKGIAAALEWFGQYPGYLHEAEPYSGALLYDLGLEEDIAPYINRVYEQLKSHGVEQVIAVDPHTTFMMKEIYPRYIKNYDIQVMHYLEILSDRKVDFGSAALTDLPKELVIHDSCYMTRDLGIVEQTRKLAVNMAIKLLEPENTKLDTACCGGPVEYAFADLSRQISFIRMQELASVCKDIIVACPICLINFMKYESELGVRVWDIGELLYVIMAERFSGTS